MSSAPGGSGRSNSGNKSPGKGGKSLQLMQQRLQSSAPAAGAPAAPVPAAEGVPQQLQQQQPQQKQQQHQPQQQQHMLQPPQPPQHPIAQTAKAPSPLARGKDFASMSANKPKGKDFSAMAARQPQPQTDVKVPAPAVVAPSTKPTKEPTPQEASLTAAAHMAPLMGDRIQSLLASISGGNHLAMDVQAQDQILSLADDFLDKVVRQSLKVCAHRGSKTMDVQDVQMVLAKQWNIVLPGLGPPKPPVLKRKSVSAATEGDRPNKLAKPSAPTDASARV